MNGNMTGTVKKIFFLKGINEGWSKARSSSAQQSVARVIEQ
jgi:hypothetical protein